MYLAVMSRRSYFRAESTRDMDADVPITDYDGDTSGSVILFSLSRASTSVKQDHSCDEALMYYNNTLSGLGVERT